MGRPVTIAAAPAPIAIDPGGRPGQGGIFGWVSDSRRILEALLSRR